MAKIAIDLGTSNTLVAMVDAQGLPYIVKIDQEEMIPSVIYIEDMGGNRTVGKHALDMWADPQDDADKYFRRWKLKIGEDNVIRELRFGGAMSDPFQVTPEQLTTYMVEFVVKKISASLGGDPVESVLVTVPHGWRRETPEKCRATRMAAAKAQVDGKTVNVQKITISEPVAAAAYWLWLAHRTPIAKELEGKTLLVCDVGGGTFDLSLILIGALEKPLDVVDAFNNDVAGDFVDALICAWICRQFNEKYGTDYPASANEVLSCVAGDAFYWLRHWFLEAQEIKHNLSDRLLQATLRGKRTDEVKPLKKSITDPADKHIEIRIDGSEFQACLEPFYEEGRKLIQTFMARHTKGKPPYAVVFAGGGSRIWGIRDFVLAPVLREFYAESEVKAILARMGRIEVNQSKLDQSIALGAALIANGVVSVQERLLHDVGIIGELDSRLLPALKLSPGTQHVMLTPVLARNACLPASVKNTDIGLFTTISPEDDTLDIKVVIDDDPHDPWIQSWKIPHPGGSENQSVEWVMEADTDGALTFRLETQSGRVEVEGRLQRKRSGRSSLVFGGNPGVAQSMLPRVTPEAVLNAIKKR